MRPEVVFGYFVGDVRSIEAFTGRTKSYGNLFSWVNFIEIYLQTVAYWPKH
jgi:hypothetical protein